jgi:hypothetical protein
VSLRLVVSDVHGIGHGGPTEPCDRDKVLRLRDLALEWQVAEVIGAGDIYDRTRGGRGGLEAFAAYLGDVWGRPFSGARIKFTYIAGNHDPYRDDLSDLTRALYRNGFEPSLFETTTGPAYRGPWQIEHGCSFDQALFGKVGEAFTRLDHWFDHLGIDLERINPAGWHPSPGEDAILDRPMHRNACRWAAQHGAHLVTGHSHRAHDIGGTWGGQTWRVLNCGAMTKDQPFTPVWITDDGDGGVVEGSEQKEAA